MNQRLPVWPYFALALSSGVIGAALLFYNLGSNVPPKEALHKFSGTVDKLSIIDDLSGVQTGFMKPMNSIHFTLEEGEEIFRYPSSWPGYTKIYEQLSFHVDVWVQRSDIGNGEPMVVFRLEQQVPENWIVPPLSISYERIAEPQSRTRRFIRPVRHNPIGVFGRFLVGRSSVGCLESPKKQGHASVVPALLFHWDFGIRCTCGTAKGKQQSGAEGALHDQQQG